MARATSPGQSRAVARIGTLVVIAIIALILLGLTVSAWRSISPGYVGIVFDKANHNVTAGALEPGWAFINGQKTLLVGQFNQGKIQVFKHLGGEKFAPGAWLQAEGKVAEIPGVW